MTTGAQHYREAEELLGEITNDDGSVSFGDGGEAYAAAAQVHATLALAAATAMAHISDVPEREGDAWYRAAATRPAFAETAGGDEP